MQEIIENCFSHDGLTSNWPCLEARPAGKGYDFFAVDNEEGITIFMAKKIQEAQAVALVTGGTLRHVLMNDEEIQEEGRCKREEYRFQNR